MLCAQKKEIVFFFDFSTSLDNLSMDKPTMLYTIPVCLFNNDYVEPSLAYKIRTNATYECKNFGSCSKPGYESGICSTTPCQNNRECFSNNCVNGICMVNDDNPIYHCENYFDNNVEKRIVKCSLFREGRCNNDKECELGERCYQNICSMGDYQKKW